MDIPSIRMAHALYDYQQGQEELARVGWVQGIALNTRVCAALAIRAICKVREGRCWSEGLFTKMHFLSVSLLSVVGGQ